MFDQDVDRASDALHHHGPHRADVQGPEARMACHDSSTAFGRRCAARPGGCIPLLHRPPRPASGGPGRRVPGLVEGVFGLLRRGEHGRLGERKTKWTVKAPAGGRRGDQCPWLPTTVPSSGDIRRRNTARRAEPVWATSRKTRGCMLHSGAAGAGAVNGQVFGADLDDFMLGGGGGSSRGVSGNVCVTNSATIAEESMPR